jgi:hypothetical protein
MGNGMKVHLSVSRFEFMLQFLEPIWLACEDEQVKLRLLQPVKDVLTVNQEIRHAIAGFYFKVFISGVIAQ